MRYCLVKVPSKYTWQLFDQNSSKGNCCMSLTITAMILAVHSMTLVIATRLCPYYRLLKVPAMLLSRRYMWKMEKYMLPLTHGKEGDRMATSRELK